VLSCVKNQGGKNHPSKQLFYEMTTVKNCTCALSAKKMKVVEQTGEEIKDF